MYEQKLFFLYVHTINWNDSKSIPQTFQGHLGAAFVCKLTHKGLPYSYRKDYSSGPSFSLKWSNGWPCSFFVGSSLGSNCTTSQCCWRHGESWQWNQINQWERCVTSVSEKGRRVGYQMARECCDVLPVWPTCQELPLGKTDWGGGLCTLGYLGKTAPQDIVQGHSPFFVSLPNLKQQEIFFQHWSHLKDISNISWS